LSIEGRQWKPASRWWGKGVDGAMMEFDIVSSAFDNDQDVLVGEAKHSASIKDIERLMVDLKNKALRCPAFKGKNIVCALWIMKSVKKRENVFSAAEVVGMLRGKN
jgi:hypothetical protein